MFKNFIAAVLFTFPTVITAQTGEMTFPSLQEQYEQAKIEEVTQTFREDPFYAGKIVDIQMYGKRITVDRKREPVSPAAKAPSNLSTLTQVLDGLDASAKASLQVEVTRQFYDSGLLKEERWNIVINGQYNVSKEALAPDKENKGAEPQP